MDSVASEWQNIQYLANLASGKIRYKGKIANEDVDPEEDARSDLVALISEEIRISRGYLQLTTQLTPYFVAAVFADPNTFNLPSYLARVVSSSTPEILSNLEGSKLNKEGIEREEIITALSRARRSLAAVVATCIWVGICKLNVSDLANKVYNDNVEKLYLRLKAMDDETESKNGGVLQPLLARVFAEEALNIGSSDLLLETVRDALILGAVNYDRAIRNVVFLSVSKGRWADSEVYNVPWKDSASSKVAISILRLILSEAGKKGQTPTIPNHTLTDEVVGSLLATGDENIIRIIRSSKLRTATGKNFSSFVASIGTSATATVSTTTRRVKVMRTAPILRLMQQSQIQKP